MTELKTYSLIQGVVGSTAYGLSTPNSDVDRLCIFTYATESLFNLTPPTDSIVTNKPDVTKHEIAKAVKLLLSCNPTVTEILWLPEHLYELTTPLGDELIKLRFSLLSAERVKNSYMGYASSQFKRLLTRGDGKFDSDTGNRTSKHARHLRRLTVQGYDLYTTGNMKIAVDNPQSYHDFGDQVSKNPEVAISYMSTVEDKFKDARTVLNEKPETEPVQEWIKKVRRQFYDF